MTKKQMATMEKLFKMQLILDGKDPFSPDVKKFIRSERKKMKRLKHAGALS
jgi:hypothetical protein